MKHTLIALLATLTVSSHALADIHASGVNDAAWVNKACSLDIVKGKDLSVITIRDSHNSYNLWWPADEKLQAAKAGPLWLADAVGVYEKEDGKTVYSNASNDAGAVQLNVVRDAKGKLENFELTHVDAKGEIVNTIICIRLRTR